MTNLIKYFTIITSILHFSGCFSNEVKIEDSPIVSMEDLANEINYLKCTSEFLEEDIANIRERYYNLSDKLFEIEFTESSKSYALFNLSKGMDGFQNVCTSSGNFFISLSSATPHLSGYKLVFSIGNPALVTYENILIKLKWNRSYYSYKNDIEFKNKTETYERENSEYLEKIKKDHNLRKALKKPEMPTRPFWSEEFKEKEFSTLKNLNPGRWTQFEIYLTPATLEQLEHIEVSLSTPVVKLPVDNEIK